MANIKNRITYLNRIHTISTHSEQDNHSTQPQASNRVARSKKLLQWGNALVQLKHVGGEALIDRSCFLVFVCKASLQIRMKSSCICDSEHSSSTDVSSNVGLRSCSRTDYDLLFLCSYDLEQN